jgi:OmpA-OmpF porin, OOP family
LIPNGHNSCGSAKVEPSFELRVTPGMSSNFNLSIRQAPALRRLCCLIFVVTVGVTPLHAEEQRQGLLYQLGEQLGLWTLLDPLTASLGVDLPATVSLVDGTLGAVTGLLLPEGDSLGLDAAGNLSLLSMDEPARTASTTVLAPDSVLVDALDQPGLTQVSSIDPEFAAGQIQGAEECPDGDGDGVCDREDQCRHTPAAMRVLANGCYLSGLEPLRLDQVSFDPDSAELKPAAFAELDSVAAMILASSARKIEISGHTDSQGNARHNQALSEARAQAVVDYLLRKGVPLHRLQARGYGEARPVGDNASEDGRVQNRRVELRIISS